MTIKPLNYDLTFTPDLAKFTFLGKEVFSFEISEPANSFSLDAVEMEVGNCLLMIANENVVRSYKADVKKEKLEIHFSQTLKPGKYNLTLDFKGRLNDKLAGFYRSKYIDEKGKEKYIATTQFEAADARRAFPCIDNPLYKATFDVRFIIGKELTAISNTLPLAEPRFPTAPVGKRVVRFERTPLMSTYLLYLGVGKFEYIEDTYKNVLLRVITTPGKSKYGTFALESTKKFLKYYEDYFDQSYPLQKLDLLAIPDFASGAMENWGAITFRENALLVYPGLSSKATLQRVAEVVAHELVHQWFGNLVTMKWWDDLWLNESFATYMAYKALDHFWPEWKVWTDYVSYSVFEAMALDAMNSTRSISSKVLSIDQIDENFDEIAYEKGGSVLRMIDGYLGHEAFRGGLRRYIKTFTYANAEAKDLWKSLDDVTKKPITPIMKSYTLQKGFPLIRARLGKKLRLSQRRFLYLDRRSKSSWVVPVVLKSSTGIDRRFLDKKDEELSLSKDSYVYINSNYSSFFISSYDEKLLALLGQHIEELNELETIGLVHDLFSLVLSNKMELKIFLNFLNDNLMNENRVEILRYLIGKLIGIYFLIKKDPLKKTAIFFAKKSLKITGLTPQEKEDINVTSLRNVSLSALTSFDDPAITKYVIDQFQQFLKLNKLHPDLRAVVFSGAVWIDEKNYYKIKNLYEKSHIQEERAKYLMAMGNSKNKRLVKDTLDYGLSKQVRFADIFYVIASTSRNPEGTEETYNWFIKNWGEFKKRTGGHSTTILRRLMKMIIPSGAIKQVRNANNFLDKHAMKGLERTYDQIREELEINAEFVKKYKV